MATGQRRRHDTGVSELSVPIYFLPTPPSRTGSAAQGGGIQTHAEARQSDAIMHVMQCTGTVLCDTCVGAFNGEE